LTQQNFESIYQKFESIYLSDSMRNQLGLSQSHGCLPCTKQNALESQVLPERRVCVEGFGPGKVENEEEACHPSIPFVSALNTT
jgi:hypothetical protein